MVLRRPTLLALLVVTDVHRLLAFSENFSVNSQRTKPENEEAGLLRLGEAAEMSEGKFPSLTLAMLFDLNSSPQCSEFAHHRHSSAPKFGNSSEEQWGRDDEATSEAASARLLQRAAEWTRMRYLQTVERDRRHIGEDQDQIRLKDKLCRSAFTPRR